MELVFGRLRNSAMLAMVAFVMYVPAGILMGLIAALRQNRMSDHAISIGSLAFIGLPEFVTGVILISVFAIKLK
jgi:peptide/nickel transport system permease protein